MIKVSRRELSNALSFLGKVVQHRTTMPVLQSIKMSVGDTLEMTATNLVTTLTRKVDIMDNGVGFSLCAPYDKLSQVISVDAGDSVILDYDNGTLTVKIGNHKVRIPTIVADEFPMINTDNMENVCYIGAEALKGCVERVAFAANRSVEIPVRNSIYFDGSASSLSLAALDGIGVMSFIDTGVDTRKSSFSFMIPLATVPLLSYLNDPVYIALGKNQIALKTVNTEIVSQIVDGQYPSYRALPPKTYDLTMRGATSDMISALKMIIPFAKEDYNVCVMDVDVVSSSAKLSSRSTPQSAQVGESSSTIPLEVSGKTDSPTIRVMFNAEYMISALQRATNKFSIDVSVNPPWARIQSDPQDGWASFVVFMQPK